MERLYRTAKPKIAAAIRSLVEAESVVVNRPVAESGLITLEAGGDFADGVIAFEGRWLDGETFVSFDKTMVKLLNGQGRAALLMT